MDITKAALLRLRIIKLRLQYNGKMQVFERTKEMLLVEDVESKEYLAGLFNAMYDELPVHRRNPAKASQSRMITQ